MIKNIFLLICCLFAPLMMPGPGNAGNEVPVEVLTAADEGLEKFVKGLPEHKKARYGFLSQREIEAAVIGQGFRVFYVAPDSAPGTGEPSNDFFLIPINSWIFLIETEGKAAAILTVDFLNNAWIPTSMGSSELAKQLNTLLEAWPETKGYRYKFIRVNEAKAEVVEISTAETTIGVVPMGSGRIALGLLKKDFDPKEVHKQSDVMKKLKKIAKENAE